MVLCCTIDTHSLGHRVTNPQTSPASSVAVDHNFIIYYNRVLYGKQYENTAVICYGNSGIAMASDVEKLDDYEHIEYRYKNSNLSESVNFQFVWIIILKN